MREACVTYCAWICVFVRKSPALLITPFITMETEKCSFKGKVCLSATNLMCRSSADFSRNGTRTLYQIPVLIVSSTTRIFQVELPNSWVCSVSWRTWDWRSLNESRFLDDLLKDRCQISTCLRNKRSRTRRTKFGPRKGVSRGVNRFSDRRIWP